MEQDFPFCANEAAHGLRSGAGVKHTSLVIVLISYLASAAHAQDQKAKAPDRTAPTGDCSQKWETLKPELEYRTICCIADPGDVDLHVVRIDPRRWKLDTAVSSRGTYARVLANEKDAAFAVNANFFDKARQPLGIIVRSGELVQQPRATSWQSIFLVTQNGRPRIVLPDKWSQYRSEARMAVQAGPRLVVDGHTVNLKPNYAAPRVGVCIQWDRDLLFFATPATRKFHVTEIAKIARRKEDQGGLACRDAMLFDGGHSVNFFAEGGVSITGDNVPVYIYATK
jgi:Phosphodiester glycosidase